MKTIVDILTLLCCLLVHIVLANMYSLLVPVFCPKSYAQAEEGVL